MNRLYLTLGLLFAVLISVHSQDDVNLFDFWKFYTDSENAMYKSSCNLAFDPVGQGERLQYYDEKEGVEDNFKYAVVDDGLLVYKQIIEWLTQ